MGISSREELAPLDLFGIETLFAVLEDCFKVWVIDGLDLYAVLSILRGGWGAVKLKTHNTTAMLAIVAKKATK